MKNDVTIGLCNPKSPSNVGAVMRAAGCYGVDAVSYTGERFARAAKFKTDTKNRQREIPLLGVESLTEDLPVDVSIVCVELAEGAIALPEFKHPAKSLYIFGPEDGSIAQDIIDQACAVVYVPTIGCMNLAATVNVVLYDRLAKSNTPVDHQAIIQKSRDVNNRLVVKEGC
ncbi:RNA methyltransferase [Marinagarivorans algicola]|uniref:RNA methyltransferase n=1 Tax=Marinagarivorans algicola TaxID=1513270 RepID=UPI0006B68ACA|nr:RNA methyltransferase [Marinagarivorans algicola]